jgi:hypothetical protein
MLAVAVTAATAALADQGDILLVTGNNVNVRAGPSTDAGILARVGIDEPATELRRLGAWVEVALPGQDVLGWIHGSLLAAAPPTADAVPEPVREPAPLAVAAVDPAPMSPSDPAAASRSAPAAVPGPIAGPAERPATVVAAAPATDAVPDAEVDPNTPLGQFRSEVEHFNDRAVAAAGVDLFTGVKPLGEGGVQVVTTEAWAIMSVPGQQSYLNALFGRWQAATGGGDDLRLQIIDADGALMMERSGP